jgi:hypothetical protein
MHFQSGKDRLGRAGCPLSGKDTGYLAVRGAIGLISARPWVWFDGEAGAESGGRESST